MPPVDPRKLQPKADVVRSFFPRQSTGRGVRREDLPRAIDRLAAALAGPGLALLREREDRTVAQARELLLTRPDISEDELVESLGGHRTIARRLINENEGRTSGQRFGARLQHDLLRSPANAQGPEAVREFVRERKEAFFSQFPTENRDTLRGAADAVAGVEESLILSSVKREAANIQQTQENQIATQARTGFTLEGGPPTVMKLKESLEAGEVSGIDPLRARGAVVRDAVTWATAEENIFEGEDILRSLVDRDTAGGPPLIEDPEQRAVVADAINRVRSLQDARQVKDGASRKQAEQLKEQELLNEMGYALFNRQPLPDRPFHELIALRGMGEATQLVSAMRDNILELEEQADDPVQVAHRMDQAARGMLTSEDILALGFSPPTTRKLLDASYTGDARSIFGSVGYKQVRQQLRARLGNEFGTLLGQNEALILRRFDEAAARLEAEDPSIIQRARTPELMRHLHEVLDVVAPPALLEEGPAGPSSGRNLTLAEQWRSARRAAAVQSRTMSQEEKALRLGQSRGVASVITGVDPVMRDVWGLPPDPELDRPETHDYQLYLQGLAGEQQAQPAGGIFDPDEALRNAERQLRGPTRRPKR